MSSLQEITVLEDEKSPPLKDASKDIVNGGIEAPVMEFCKKEF